MNEEKDQEAAGISHDMALAALDLLARVIARKPAAFRSFHRLAVNHARARRGFTPLDFAQAHDQHRIHDLEQPGITPGVKIAPDGRDRRKAFRQQAPRAPGRGYVEHRIDHLAHIRRAGAATPFRRGYKWHDQSPLPVRRIRWISQSFPAMFTSGNTSPCHHSLHLFVKTDESQQAGIVLIFTEN
ncbi:hypothetical protein GLUCOINTEAF2_0204042 [Komagataeibacter intermedius AF2]|uniref:Uncharacterized protein n=1 Tax=Komagataeibacter intermedius AF2 TaxID=1458464 RepID=A0A0N1FC78_9PROT|nr:hypothetical protein GLUCOINTEAF2_0204042 [Komagataeibacter intermedius AF2]